MVTFFSLKMPLQESDLPLLFGVLQVMLTLALSKMETALLDLMP